MDVVFKGRVLADTTVRKRPRVAVIEDDKTLDARVDAIVARELTGGSKQCAACGAGLWPGSLSCWSGVIPRQSPGTSLLCPASGYFYFALTVGYGHHV